MDYIGEGWGYRQWQQIPEVFILKKKKCFYSSKNTVSAVKTVGFNGGEWGTRGKMKFIEDDNKRR